MASEAKTTTSGELTSKKKLATDDTPGFKFKVSDWLVLVVGAVAVFCWYYVATTVGSLPDTSITFSNILINPTLTFLLVAIFGSLYVYIALRRKLISRWVQAIALLISAVFIASSIYIMLGIGRACIGLFDVQSECVGVHYFVLTLLLLNPYALLIWNTLAVAGVAGFLIKPKQSL